MQLNKQMYDLLTEDFSRTRATVWEEFKSLGEYFQDGDTVLDLGCGNGRFFELINGAGREIKYFGADNSEKLVQLAKQRYQAGKFVLTDGLILPFADNFFDKILCIAVLHHLPGRELQREFLREAYRVLKPNGRLILTTWEARPGKRRWRSLLKYTWLKIIGKSNLDWGDFYEPWGEKGLRYFHNFSKKELCQSLGEVNFDIQEAGFLNRRSGEKNLLVVAKKECSELLF